MKKILLTITLGLILNQVHAQKSVNFSGQIKNANSTDLIYLGFENALIPLNSIDGTFSTEGSIQQSPSFFYFAYISKQGKIEHQTPLIWFERDSVHVHLDWSNKSIQMEGSMSFQSISESIEALKGNRQIEFILNNPNNLPSLYFAYSLKDKISISELEKYTQTTNEKYTHSIYLKQIENYVSAKKLQPLKKGVNVKDFKLPDKDGNQLSVTNRSKKTQLIALLSSGCSFSIASISLLERFSELNKNKIEITTIWDDKSRDTWFNAHQDKKSKITWTDLWDEFGFASAYLRPTISPSFYVINEDSVLVDFFYGYKKKTAGKLKKLME